MQFLARHPNTSATATLERKIERGEKKLDATLSTRRLRASANALEANDPALALYQSQRADEILDRHPSANTQRRARAERAIERASEPARGRDRQHGHMPTLGKLFWATKILQCKLIHNADCERTSDRARERAIASVESSENDRERYSETEPERDRASEIGSVRSIARTSTKQFLRTLTKPKPKKKTPNGGNPPFGGKVGIGFQGCRRL